MPRITITGWFGFAAGLVIGVSATLVGFGLWTHDATLIGGAITTLIVSGFVLAMAIGVIFYPDA